MKSEPIALPADPAEAEDLDATAEALDRGQRARLIRRTRTTAPDIAIAYVRVIGQHPDMVAKAVAWAGFAKAVAGLRWNSVAPQGPERESVGLPTVRDSPLRPSRRVIPSDPLILR